ncbi:MAG: ice-binding family protein, partial [Chloroflexi bacterium]|nr:ice-binding family protein [Chloroflexota bacterium]
MFELRKLTKRAIVAGLVLFASAYPGGWGFGGQLAAAGPPLGSATSYAVVGGAGVTAAGGAGTVITGDVGSAPTASITGFPPAVVTAGFDVHRNDASAIAAQGAVGGLFTALDAGVCTATLVPQLNGVTLGPGIYCFTSSADLAALGNLTLSGAGTYIFRVGSALTANVGSRVTLVGVDPCEVFWQVTSAATLNGVS